MYHPDDVLVNVIVMCELGIGLKHSRKLILIRLPCFNTIIGSGCDVLAQLWDRVAIFRQSNCLGLGFVIGPMMCDNCMLMSMLIIL